MHIPAFGNSISNLLSALVDLVKYYLLVVKGPLTRDYLSGVHVFWRCLISPRDDTPRIV